MASVALPQPGAPPPEAGAKAKERLLGVPLRVNALKRLLPPPAVRPKARFTIKFFQNCFGGLKTAGDGARIRCFTNPGGLPEYQDVSGNRLLKRAEHSFH